MKNSMKSMLLAAAVTGLITGATALQAESSSSTAQVAGTASVLNTSYMQTDKHSCKGKNACKGQGADHKNACKGQGSCATDGSK